MMLATMKYQIGARNEEDTSSKQEAHRHYRYSLSFFKHLLMGHTWQDVQALAMIACHMRNFPKPGAAWVVVSMTFLVAIELGLHRTTKAWADAGTMDRTAIEMRKRIFWALHAMATGLSGKLGRPMLICVEDIDVEYPEPDNDCVPGTQPDDLSVFNQCSFQVGIQTSKYSRWHSELFRTVYALRTTPRGYEEAVRRLEEGIRRWREEIPRELVVAAPDSSDYIFRLYLEFWELQFDLLLHHPAVCRSEDPKFFDENLDKCLAASEKMLHNSSEMQKLRSLDITWTNTVVYVAAIFTTLFIQQKRRDKMTLVDMAKLRSDMTQWLVVIGTCGQLLGKISGNPRTIQD